MKTLFRVGLFLLLAFLLVIAATYTLGPGLRDGGINIGQEYEYFDAGGNEKSINRYGDIVVDARVDDYLTVGDKIYIARRSLDIVNPNQSPPKWELSSRCEFLILDMKDNTIRPTINHGNVKCNMNK